MIVNIVHYIMEWYITTTSLNSLTKWNFFYYIIKCKYLECNFLEILTERRPT